MADWKQVRLGDHVDLITGFPFRSAQFTDDPNDIRLLKGANVGQGTLKWSNAARWKHHEREHYAEYELRAGDVILAMDRPWIEAGLKQAEVTERDLPALLVQRVARLRGVCGLLTRYLRFLIASPAFTDYIRPIVTGVNVPHISASQIEDFKFALPQLAVQRKTAAVLGAYDELIENNLRRIEILEEMAQAIYREWFVDFRYPGHEQHNLANSPLGPIPEGWDARPVDEAVALNPRTRLESHAERSFISMTCLVEGSMVIRPPERRTGSGGSQFMNGDTLLARITPSLENGKTGFVQLLAQDEIARGSTEFIVMRAVTLSPEWVYLFARREDFRATAIKSMVGASGRQRVQESSVRAFVFPHPPVELIDRFTELVRPMFRLIQKLVDQNRNLATTRELLLPKLITGEIDVSELDIDTSWLAA